MPQFVEIIDSNAVRANTNLQLNGISASSKEWTKHNFYPNKGVVGILLTDEAMGPEGRMCVLQCGNTLFVPILPNGVKYITENEFKRRLPNNEIIGEDKENKNSDSFVNDVMNYMDSMFRRR